MNASARASLRNAVLIVVAVLLLVLAGWRLARSRDPSGAAPTDESSWVHFVCEACGAYFHLNGREVDKALRSGDVTSTGIKGRVSFRCKQCGQLKAVRAEKCPRHAVIIKIDPRQGEPARCPECGWRP